MSDIVRDVVHCFTAANPDIGVTEKDIFEELGRKVMNRYLFCKKLIFQFDSVVS